MAQITLPGNTSVTGKVDWLGRVVRVPAGQNNNAGQATIPAFIGLDDPGKAGGLDFPRYSGGAAAFPASGYGAGS